MKSIVALIGLVLCMETTAQDRALLPPPPPLRNPMLVPEKIVPAPPSLGVVDPFRASRQESRHQAQRHHAVFSADEHPSKSGCTYFGCIAGSAGLHHQSSVHRGHSRFASKFGVGQGFGQHVVREVPSGVQVYMTHQPNNLQCRVLYQLPEGLNESATVTMQASRC